MSFELSIENQRGEVLSLTNDPDYAIGQIDGLNPPTASISTSKRIGFDGEDIQSVYVNSRTISIYVYLFGDVEAARLRLYRYVRIKQYLKIHFRNYQRDVYAEGRVQDIQIDHFAQNQVAQIVVYCPYPYFKDILSITDGGSQVIDTFSFAFSCNDGDHFAFGTFMEIPEIVSLNNGEIVSGMQFVFKMNGNVKNPKIFNRATGEFFALNYEFQAGDVVTISTHFGSKYARLLRNAETVNIFNAVTPASVWLQLDIGDNVFVFEADEGQDMIELSIIHTDEFEGV